MTREKLRKNNHKAPKFRDTYDESLDWQDRLEIQHAGRKVKRKVKKRRDGFEKW